MGNLRGRIQDRTSMIMKNARKRNELRDKYNIIGLEMEAAGTMNRIPVG